MHSEKFDFISCMALNNSCPACVSTSSSAGLDLETQEAYEMAAQGLIRPKTREAGPVIYGFKCIDLSPPHFTLGKRN